jgi:CHAT domain-containing protein/tetratricopeptide (TPR) repeat protein
MKCLIASFTLLALALVCVAAADEPTTAPEDKSQWPRMLEGDDAKRARELRERIDAAEPADHYDEAIKLQEELLELRSRVQGADHWETTNEKRELDYLRRIGALPDAQRANWLNAVQRYKDARKLEADGQPALAEPMLREALALSIELLGEKHSTTAAAYATVALNLSAQERFKEAEPLCRKTLDLYRELFGEMHPHTAGAYDTIAHNLASQRRYAEAEPYYQKALDARLETLGEKHHDTAGAYYNLAYNLASQDKNAAAEANYRKALELNIELFGEKHLNTAHSYAELARILCDQGRDAEAETLNRKALALFCALLGDKHRYAATTCAELGRALDGLGKHAEAQSFIERALDLYRELLGEKHPSTAIAYGNLAYNLDYQGKHAEAQPLHQKVLDLRRELFGEMHPSIEISYRHLASNLRDQGKYAEAAPLYQQALVLSRELFGEKHLNTVRSYSGLAINLDEQGSYVEAEALHEKALDVCRELLGDKHLETAFYYNNLANNLTNQRKYGGAQALAERALDLRLELLGDSHHDTARSYDKLAHILYAQGKYADAQRLSEKALRMRQKLLGEKHPLTASSYSNLALILGAQEKYSEAESYFKRAIALERELLGDHHDMTAASQHLMANNLLLQRRYKDALPYLEKAVIGYEAARLSLARGGLERAAFGEDRSPYPRLAVTLARLNDRTGAWIAAEADLARGFNDAAVARRGAGPGHEARSCEATLRARMAEIERLILPLVGRQSPTDAERAELKLLRDERHALETELTELAVALSKRELATLAEVQAAMNVDDALVMWAGPANDRWGCVVRRTGGPAWERLPGTGPEGEWTDDDGNLPQKFAAAIADGASANEVAELARQLYLQRLAPLDKHLQGVARLFVVPVRAVARVPLEVLTDRYNIVYVPSGTFLARLKKGAVLFPGPLLAVGNPVFDDATQPADAPLPPGGLLVKQVLAGGNGARAALQPGDVLLKYADADVTSYQQYLALIQQHGGNTSIDLCYWRDGTLTTVVVPPGKLGLTLELEPAPQFLAAKHAANQTIRLAMRGGDWKELPGTAAELQRLSASIGKERTTLLTRSSASEQQLEELRASGKLAEFRYLHFATHGAANSELAFESALILAQDDNIEDVSSGGKKHYDGRLTANEVLETWKLDNAELVTLSACESALGRPGGGDGLLGFAQAFLLAGARAVCLSLWKVDDTATALLMDRFYQNLLGKREGLSQPMGKAAALAEAKQWLRNLSLDEATQLAADITSGVVRGNNEPALKLVVPTAEPQAPTVDDNRPFAHPRYWAAFILIGDPN